MGLLKALGVTKRVNVERGEWGRGVTAADGSPLMSRTDPRSGRALGFDERGFDGRGTPDEDVARSHRGKRR